MRTQPHNANPARRYFAAKRAALRPSPAADRLERRRLADWLAVDVKGSPRTAAVLRGKPKLFGRVVGVLAHARSRLRTSVSNPTSPSFPPASSHVETQSAQHPPKKVRGGRFCEEARR